MCSGSHIGEDYNTPKHSEFDLRSTINHSRPSEASDLIWLWMTLDDLDTGRVIYMYSQFVNADLVSGIHFALSNDL